MIKKIHFDDELENINEKVISNKAKHVEGENELNGLSKKFKLICYAVCSIRAVTIRKINSNCKKNKLQVNSTSNTSQRKNDNFD